MRRSLPDGREVIVKVLRPGMRSMIALDLEVLYTIAGMAERWWTESRRLKPLQIVREYENTVLDELDLMREAANASQLKRNFAGSMLLYVPEIYWDYCRTAVLVMERIHGIPIGDVARLREPVPTSNAWPRTASRSSSPRCSATTSSTPTCTRATSSCCSTIRHGRATPRSTSASSARWISAIRRYLAENFLAVFDRDYRRVATLHVQSGWVPPDTRIDEMESAVRTICEPIFDRPLKEISFGTVLLRLFEALRRFNGQIQPQLLLLQKTLLNVEGLGRQLYPELDIWQTASPVLRKWMRDRLSSRNIMRELRLGWPDALEIIKALPPLAKRLVEHAQDGTLRLQVDARAIDQLRQETADQARRADRIVIGAALMLGGVLWLGMRLNPRWIGIFSGASGLAVWFAVWVSRRR